MAVFDDPKKELEQLQQQLLQDEAWFEKELDSARRLLGEEVPPKKAPAAPVNAAAPAKPKPAATKAKSATAKANPAPVQEEAPKTKGIRGLVILAVLETLGIVGVVAYWLLVLLK